MNAFEISLFHICLPASSIYFCIAMFHLLVAYDVTRGDKKTHRTYFTIRFEGFYHLFIVYRHGIWFVHTCVNIWCFLNNQIIAIMKTLKSINWWDESYFFTNNSQSTVPGEHLLMFLDEMLRFIDMNFDE